MTGWAGVHRRAEGGQVTLLGLGLIVVVLFVGGVSLDLWRVVGERRGLAEQADAAAAAGANGIDVAAYRQTGVVLLDPDLARRLAMENLVAQQDVGSLVGSPSVLADADVVVVEVGGRVELTLLRLLLFDEAVDLRVRAEARPRRGLSDEVSLGQ